MLGRIVAAKDGRNVRAEVAVAFEHFAVFAINGVAIRIELAHVAALNFQENFFDFVLESVTQNGAAQNVELIAQRISYFYEIFALASLQVFPVLFMHQVVPQHVILF